MNTKQKHSTIEMTKPISIMTSKVKMTPNIKYELLSANIMLLVSLLLNLGKLSSSRRPSLTAFLALGFTGIGHLVFVSAVGIARIIFNFVLLVVPL